VPDSFVHDLGRFDLAAYEAEVRRYGLLAIGKDSPAVRQIQSFARRAERLVSDRQRSGATILAEGLGHESTPDCADDIQPGNGTTNSVAVVAAYFFVCQHHNLSDATRLYDHYASIPLLRHLLQLDTKVPLAEKRARVWSVFQDVLAAQVSFEHAAIAGRLPAPTRDFSPEVARQRIAYLEATHRAVPVDCRVQLACPPAGDHEPDLRVIVGELGQPAVVRRLLVFPQTTCHDEVAFIRLVQLAECLFWGSLIYVARALRELADDNMAAALSAVRTATEFANPLVKVFRAVRTMPPDHFLGFRHTTDHASAIQSLSWQLLDAHMYGVLPEKAAVLMGIPSIQPDIESLARADFAPLVPTVNAAAADGTELRAATIALDQALRAWRTFHEKQLAGRSAPAYVPAGVPGTGGTAGYQYLAAQRPPRLSRLAGAARVVTPASGQADRAS
jgi:hypothetical protein